MKRLVDRGPGLNAWRLIYVGEEILNMANGGAAAHIASGGGTGGIGQRAGGSGGKI
jgi:hypothetical protein